MYYALRRRIGEQEPVLLYQGEISYLFCSAGVLIVPEHHGFEFRSKVWAIVDTVNAPDGLPKEMNTLAGNIFPIYLTSPKPSRWSPAHQFWSVHLAIMNPWTKEEIQYA